MMKRRCPWWAYSFMMCHRIGFSPISTSGLGTRSVSSRRRVPRPPARITTGMSAGSRRLNCVPPSRDGSGRPAQVGVEQAIGLELADAGDAYEPRALELLERERVVAEGGDELADAALDAPARLEARQLGADARERDAVGALVRRRSAGDREPRSRHRPGD